ncbi:ABC transporter substrate-binding protein [Halalkalibacter krulwichiae]|uniref:Leucine-, isoleucine-, valine-, threonine-, and alanine-binding protein n=1 Tax=Halalkalibacter krulwichiae TaxID=199441 RepID=A0A1X9MDV8_9BACI|nr:ABC transporter substrate-binding protein [Halalkalibacter krulwichiae]ARK29731.1 Leucine-, isoleucine-, valine-, threonine-, and alanine-binding protein precursor [Halalkalibacter krulwichiae]
MKKNFTIIKLLTTVMSFVLIMSLFACNSPSDSSGSGTDSNGQSDTIKIGMTSALTGSYSEFGEGNRRAVEIAVEKWNAEGGINGKEIELVVYDDQLVPDQAAVNMQRILDDDEIVAVIGPAGSGPALATVPMTEAKGIVHINPVAQTIDVTYPHGTDQSPRENVFSFALQNNVEAEAIANFVGERWDKIGIVHESTAYGVSGSELIEEVLQEKFNKEPVGVEQYNQQAADMTAQLSRINREGAEVVVTIGLGADLANVRRGMSRLNMDIPLISSNGALSQPYQDGAGDLIVGTIGSMIGALGNDPLEPEAAEFAEMYLEKHGKDQYWGNGETPQLFMSLNVINAYDGANVLFEAIKQADSTETDEIIAALHNIKDFKGVNATYSFDKSKHHAIETEHIGMFHYVDDGDEIKLVPYVD